MQEPRSQNQKNPKNKNNKKKHRENQKDPKKGRSSTRRVLTTFLFLVFGFLEDFLFFLFFGVLFHFWLHLGSSAFFCSFFRFARNLSFWLKPVLPKCSQNAGENPPKTEEKHTPQKHSRKPPKNQKEEKKKRRGVPRSVKKGGFFL